MVDNSQILRHAIDYSAMFGIPVINHPENTDLKNSGIAQESLFSTEKGLPAIPSIAETIAIYRDLEIANYVNGNWTNNISDFFNGEKVLFFFLLGFVSVYFVFKKKLRFK